MDSVKWHVSSFIFPLRLGGYPMAILCILCYCCRLRISSGLRRGASVGRRKKNPTSLVSSTWQRRMRVHLPSGLSEGITRRRSDVHLVAEEERRCLLACRFSLTKTMVGSTPTEFRCPCIIIEFFPFSNKFRISALSGGCLLLFVKLIEKTRCNQNGLY